MKKFIRKLILTLKLLALSLIAVGVALAAQEGQLIWMVMCCAGWCVEAANLLNQVQWDSE